jgi:polar amino acid transport system permease protein
VSPSSSAPATTESPALIKAIPARHPWRWVGAAVILACAATFANTLINNKAFQWSFMWGHIFDPPILEGARTTILITILAMVLGVVLGVVVAVMRLSSNPVLAGTAWVYTWFFRAVPRLVLLFTVGNLGVLSKTIDLGLPLDWLWEDLFGIDITFTFVQLDSNTLVRGFMAGLIGLALSEAAYMAEIVRAGILSVDTGQAEAAQALGMSRGLTLRRIVLPQALRVIVPPTGNEAIAMLKDTSLLIAIPVTTELFFQISAVGSRTFQIFPMFVAACLWYLAMASLLMVGQYFLERRFSRGYTGATPAVRVPAGGEGGA